MANDLVWSHPKTGNLQKETHPMKTFNRWFNPTLRSRVLPVRLTSFGVAPISHQSSSCHQFGCTSTLAQNKDSLPGNQCGKVSEGPQSDHHLQIPQFNLCMIPLGNQGLGISDFWGLELLNLEQSNSHMPRMATDPLTGSHKGWCCLKWFICFFPESRPNGLESVDALILSFA